MKTKLLLLMTCSTFLLASCSPKDLTDKVKQAGDTMNKLASGAAASLDEFDAELTTPTATPAPKEQTLSLGKKGTVGNWKITAQKVTVKKKIKNGTYLYFKPSKGKTFVVVSLSVRNNGDKADDFLPRIGYEDKMIQATLIHQDKTEYKPTELLSYDKDLATKEINAKSTEKGIITFEVPKKVAKAKKKLKLRIGTSKEYIIYNVK